MSRKAFSQAMEQIAREAEELQQKEQAEAVRQAKLARIRKICMTVIGIALVTFAYINRRELGQKVFNVMASAAEQADRAEQAQAAESGDHSGEPIRGQKMSKSLQALRGAASERDNALEELTKR